MSFLSRVLHPGGVAVAFLQTNPQQKKAFLISFIGLSTIVNSLQGRGVCQMSGGPPGLDGNSIIIFGTHKIVTNCASNTAIPRHSPLLVPLPRFFHFCRIYALQLFVDQPIEVALKGAIFQN